MATRPVTAGDEMRRRSESKAAADKPEKKLNSIVFLLASVERAGNAVGTLAFIWATVVLLGGFCSNLNPKDFWFVTAMVFTEAIRVFIRNDFSVNQWLLGSTRALRAPDFSFALMLARPQEGIRVAVTISLCSRFPPLFPPVIVTGIQVVLLVVIWQLLVRGLLKVRFLKLVVLIPLFLLLTAISAAIVISRVSHWGLYIYVVGFHLAVPIILQLVALFFATDSLQKIVKRLPLPRRWVKYITFIRLFFWPLTDAIIPISPSIASISMLLLSLGTIQAPGSNNSSGRILDFILHVLFFLTLMCPLPGISFHWSLLIMLPLLATMLIGNLQFPLATLQVGLSIWRLGSLVGGYNQGASQNMVPSIAVFFALELLQGLSYIVASILGWWSLFPLRSLVRDSGLRGELGYKAVDLYYHWAYHRLTEEALFLSEKYTASLASFAVKSLNSSSTTRSLGFSSSEMQLGGLCILDTFLAKPDSDTYKEVITDITFISKETVPTLVAMLGRTAAQDRDIRLLAASVIARLAGSGSLKNAEVPGTMKMVSSLLDAESRQDSLPNPAAENNGGNDDNNTSPFTHTPFGIARGDAVNENQVPVQEEATDSNGGYAACWQRMKKWWSKWRIPPEETDRDTLPVLGMPTLDNPAAENNGGNDDNNTSPFTQTRDGIARGDAENEHWVPVQEEATDSNGGDATCWQRMKKWWSKWRIPPEETDRDTLPVLGMRILENLACDPDYCAEIVKDTTRIITNIKVLIDSYCTTNNEDSDHTQQKQQEKMILSSLNLVRNLAITGGKTGTTFCKVLWENPSLPHILQIMSQLERS